jgi:Skp family chaperone for outer membrane proteins
MMRLTGMLRVIAVALAMMLTPLATPAAAQGGGAVAVPVRVVVLEDLVMGSPPEALAELAKLNVQLEREFAPRVIELRYLETKIKAATTPEEKARLERDYQIKSEDAGTAYARRQELLYAPVKVKMDREFPLFVASMGGPEIVMVTEADLAARPDVAVVKITADFAAWMNARP